MSGESLLETREEVTRIKEGVCQEGTGVKGIPIKIGCSVTPVSLLQVYIVITYWTSLGLYARWAAFEQHLLSN